jgi:hypothetical protein
LVETRTLYDVAPGETVHVNVGLVEIPVAPSDGEASVGVEGAAERVVKL